MEAFLHIGFPHSIHIAAGHQCKLRIAEQPAGTEQLALQPQAVLQHAAVITPSSGVRIVKMRSDSL